MNKPLLKVIAKISIIALIMGMLANASFASVSSNFSLTAITDKNIPASSFNELALDVLIPDGTNGGSEDVLIRDGSNDTWNGESLTAMGSNDYFIDDNYDGSYQGTEAIVNTPDSNIDPGELVANGKADFTFFIPTGTAGAEFVFDDNATDDNDYSPGEAIFNDDVVDLIPSGTPFPPPPFPDTVILKGMASVMNFANPPTIMWEDGGICGTANGLYDPMEPIWDDGPGAFPGAYDAMDVILSDPARCLTVPPPPPPPFFIGTFFAGPSNAVFLDTNHDGIYNYTAGTNGEPIVFSPAAPLGPGMPLNPGDNIQEAYLTSGLGDIGIGGTYTHDWIDMNSASIGPYKFIGSTSGADIYSGSEPIVKDSLTSLGVLNAGEVIYGGVTPAMIQTWGTQKHTGSAAYTSNDDIYNDTGPNAGTLDKKEDQLNDITIQNDGTATDSDISALKLWKDGGDGSFDAGGGSGDDSLVGTFTWDSTDSWELTGLTTTIPAGGLHLYVTVDIVANPSDGNTIDLKIPQLSDGGTSGVYNSGDEGVFVASDNDGPTDSDVKPASGNVLTIDTSLPPPISVCGNNTVEAGEECDDGNTDDGDGCDSVCQYEGVCGNEIVELGEECDDGNTDDGDGCSATCTDEEIHNYEEVEGLDHSEVVSVADLFSDYDIDFWAAAYIAKLYLENVVEGYEDGTFGVGLPTKRGEMVKIALLANGISVPETVTNSPFPDTPLDQWFTPYIKVAYDMGIIEGYDDGTFRPGDNVKRVEALKIILLAADIDPSGSDLSVLTFDDVLDTDWFAEILAYAVINDIVKGYNDNTFKPGQNIVRAEIAKIAVKVMLL